MPYTMSATLRIGDIHLPPSLTGASDLCGQSETPLLKQHSTAITSKRLESLRRSAFAASVTSSFMSAEV